MGHEVDIIKKRENFEGVAMFLMLVSVIVSLLFAYQTHEIVHLNPTAYSMASIPQTVKRKAG